MSAEYEVWLCNDRGEKLYPFGGEFESLNYTRVVNGVGKLHGFSVRADELDPDSVQVDYQLQVWRRPAGGANRLDFLAFIRHWKWQLDAGGAVKLVIEDCPDQNELLGRRIVAYYSGHVHAYAVNEPADNALRDVFDENLGESATDTARVLPLTTREDTDPSLGPLIDKSYAWQSVMEVLPEISDESRQAGAEVFFDLAVNDVDYGGAWTTFQFRTYVGQPGADRTHDSENPVIFGPAFENVEEMERVHDYRGEENAIYVAGQGVGGRRTVELVQDEAAQVASVWNRREGFVDARDVENVEMDAQTGANPLLIARGQQRLAETRPRAYISGRVRSTEHTLYGRDWDLGYRVTVNALKVQFDALIRVVNVQVQNGRERVTGLVEAEL